MEDLEEFRKKLLQYIQVLYGEGGRWLDRAQELGKKLIRGSPEGAIFTQEACSFLNKATNWQDLFRRQHVLYDPPQQAPKDIRQRLLGTDIWLHTNKEIQKTLAQICTKFLNKFGLPTGRTEWNKFLDILLYYFNITAEKEIIKQAGEEEITEEVPVEKGWFFKKTVIEKRVIKRPRKAAIREPRTPLELINELARFA